MVLKKSAKEFFVGTTKSNNCLNVILWISIISSITTVPHFYWYHRRKCLSLFMAPFEIPCFMFEKNTYNVTFYDIFCKFCNNKYFDWQTLTHFCNINFCKLYWNSLKFVSKKSKLHKSISYFLMFSMYYSDRPLKKLIIQFGKSCINPYELNQTSSMNFLWLNSLSKIETCHKLLNPYWVICVTYRNGDIPLFVLLRSCLYLHLSLFWKLFKRKLSI